MTDFSQFSQVFLDVLSDWDQEITVWCFYSYTFGVICMMYVLHFYPVRGEMSYDCDTALWHWFSPECLDDLLISLCPAQIQNTMFQMWQRNFYTLSSTMCHRGDGVLFFDSLFFLHEHEVHPSIILTAWSLYTRGNAGTYPSWLVGYTMDRSPVFHRADM